ncbi:MAG: hypothetical protein CL402_00260 [Acidiferrobacteraceae bacterium]|nr:hypothetical protein [Acidiferrobacteraceae bacterium]|tara:strand:- start:699 stop:1076 length:378 start_codon:yes stop_codon:yes gene_type:complete
MFIFIAKNIISTEANLSNKTIIYSSTEFSLKRQNFLNSQKFRFKKYAKKTRYKLTLKKPEKYRRVLILLIICAQKIVDLIILFKSQLVTTHKLQSFVVFIKQEKKKCFTDKIKGNFSAMILQILL